MNPGKIQELKTFFDGLKMVTSNANFDLGLIIKKKDQLTEEITEHLAEPFETADIDQETFADDFLKKMIQVFNDKKWLVVGLRHTWIPDRIYNQLRLLSCVNRLDILNLDGEGDTYLKQPKESKIVLVISEDLLDNIEIPNFLDLFGPVVRV